MGECATQILGHCKTGMTPVFTVVACFAVTSNLTASEPKVSVAIYPAFTRPLGLPIESMYNHEWYFSDPNTGNSFSSAIVGNLQEKTS